MPHADFTGPVIVVGASAGGVEALGALLTDLGVIGAPVLVVLHIPPFPRSELRQVLAAFSAMPVVDAEDGLALQAGTVYVACADRHLLLGPHGIRVTRGPKECRMRPAVDVLFRSASVVHGTNVLGVVLSGALDDGTAGLWAIKDAGGKTLVQDPAEAVFSSMPDSALAHVAVDHVGPVRGLADYLKKTVQTTMSRPGSPPATTAGHAIENTIAMGGVGLDAGVMTLGRPSNFSCPDCHGVLRQIEEGAIVRYRCHTGHAYSELTLLAEIQNAVTAGLWDAIRALEENVLLLRQAAQRRIDQNAPQAAQQLYALAAQTEGKLGPLRAMVLADEPAGGPSPKDDTPG